MSSRSMQIVGATLLAMLVLVGGQGWAQTPPPQPHPQTGAPQRNGHVRSGHGRPVIGTVASVSGSSIVVTTWSGHSVTVQTTSTTRVLSRQQAKPTDLQSGDRVRILATKASNNTVVALRLSDTPAALAPTGGRGRTDGAGPSRGGLWSGRGNMVMIAGTLTGAATGGGVTVTMPAGPPLSVAVPSTARLSRLVSLPITGLTVGTHVAVMGTPAASGGITATTIYVPGMTGH